MKAVTARLIVAAELWQGASAMVHAGTVAMDDVAALLLPPFRACSRLVQGAVDSSHATGRLTAPAKQAQVRGRGHNNS